MRHEPCTGTRRLSVPAARASSLLGALLLSVSVCLGQIANPDPTPAAETIRLSVGSLSPLQPAADWATEGVMPTPSGSEPDDILPFASNDSNAWPNVYSPLTTQAVFQEGLWETSPTSRRDIQFAHRFQWMRAAS
ncbi:hypothetical protein HZA57_07735 [Candidatus Poribacteria bacterium]|nr:hypothetical protein [Candidatus Poribacteria bacterium]